MQETVLITGCSSGIGRASAEAFLEEGWLVYATARNPADIETLGERENCRIATLDVTDDGDVSRVVDRAVEEAGRIDCLVNNAGYGQYGAVEDVPVDQVHRQFDVNVYGPHRLTRAVLPHMREDGGGTVVNVSSVSGRLPLPMTGVYAGSKHALEAMSDALRTEVREFDVDVVLVEPGPVESDFYDRVDDEMDGDGGGDGDDDGGGVPGIEHSGAYPDLYEAFADATSVRGAVSVTPERVAADVVDAASSTRPHARYQSGPVARLGTLARHLPARWLDALVGFAVRLT
jgi:NAD(P)-dependent dehydrogenase (short-subunit alcohol dehydrogenase family)